MLLNATEYGFIWQNLHKALLVRHLVSIHPTPSNRTPTPPKRQVARSNRAEPTTSFNFQSVEEAACGEQERKRKRRHHPTGRETGGGKVS